MRNTSATDVDCGLRIADCGFWAVPNPQSAIRNPQFVARLCHFLACALLLIPLLPAQDEEKIQKLFREAIEAMGGETYLKVTDTVSEGKMKSFKNAVKHSLDNILRFRWKDPQNKVFYLGPGEGGDVSLELVQILDPENDTVTIYFDRLSKLPAKVEYRDVDKRGVHLRNVEEYSQWHVVQGVKLPLRIDGFVNGRKASQLFLTKITLSNNLLDSFFSKPVPPK